MLNQVTVRYWGPGEIQFGPFDHAPLVSPRAPLWSLSAPAAPVARHHSPLSEPHPEVQETKRCDKAEALCHPSFQRQIWIDCSIFYLSWSVWGSTHRWRWRPGGRSRGRTRAPEPELLNSWFPKGLEKCPKHSGCSHIFLEEEGGETEVQESRGGEKGSGAARPVPRVCSAMLPRVALRFCSRRGSLDTPPPPASQGNDSPHRKKKKGGGRVGRKKDKGLASGYILFFLRLPRDFARLD